MHRTYCLPGPIRADADLNMPQASLETPRASTQSQTGTGQSGTGVRGTTGEGTEAVSFIPGCRDDQTGGERKRKRRPRAAWKPHQRGNETRQSRADSGKKGDDEGVAKHAGAAKPHVEAAIQQNSNEHLTAAMKSLDSAIEHSRMGHADMAGQAANEAVSHLKKAKE